METGTAGRIVLVEDEGLLRKIIGRNLRARGYQVVEVATGEDALAVLAGGSTALLLLDVNLPDITGWEVLRRFSAGRPSPIPTIVFSAVAPNAKRLEEFGWVTFVHKPFPLDALLRLVADQVGERPGPRLDWPGIGAPTLPLP